jgi:transcriptional regulator with XRE-family HTH domain
MKEIGEEIKTCRLAVRMTLKQLGAKTGYSDAYLSQLERGRANPWLNAGRTKTLVIWVVSPSTS